MIELSSIEFKCRVTTPMFIGGAEPNEKPEIRTQSIKGLLRWHWRALQDPKMSIPELKRKEGELFGIASDKSNDSSKSLVSIAVHMDPNAKYFKFKDSNSKSLRGTPSMEGNRNYLTYFQGAGDNDKAYWPVGTEFRVVFSGLPSSSEKLKEYADLFVLLATLGGFGSRTSRVVGGFQIDDAVTQHLDWDTDQVFDLPDDVIKKWTKSPGSVVPVHFESHNNSSFLVVDTGLKDLHKVLDFVGRHLKGVRSAHKEIRDRGFFGLPVKVDKRFGADKVKVVRQNSPLRIRLAFDEDGMITALFQIHWLEGFTADDYSTVFKTLRKNVREELEASEVDNPILLNRLS
jgi:CRISPR type III-B/RAMP module RAMP protein Cmr1